MSPNRARDLHGRVQSVDRAMRILEVLGEEDKGKRLIDLSSQTGLSPSTAHRLLTTLEHRHFVQFSKSEGLWHVGRQSFAVGSAFLRKSNLVAPALPFLRRLRDQTRETANLGMVEDGEIVIISQVESREITRFISRVGGRVPMAASGMGKALLASYSAEALTTHLKRKGMRKVTSSTLIRRQALDAQLAVSRTEGYAVDDEEFVPGLRCVAAAVYGDQSEVLCAISVSGLPSRITWERVPVLGRLVVEASRQMTISLGGIFPDQCIQTSDCFPSSV